MMRSILHCMCGLPLCGGPLWTERRMTNARYGGYDQGDGVGPGLIGITPPLETLITRPRRPRSSAHPVTATVLWAGATLHRELFDTSGRCP